ncbi:hypothetical protein Barb4_04053 [Bacteroidales bacterium Barb4]|nr:hypothetical protein Barb4_04053 [Bacteroidales bacterium Barb4]
MLGSCRIINSETGAVKDFEGKASKYADRDAVMIRTYINC